jgi:hypothetical protein
MQPYQPFRFGIAAYDAPTRGACLGLARRAEALGYSSLAINDHLGTQPAPIAAIAAAAQETTTLRLGCAVFANDFRHPVILAKETASLDVLSEAASNSASVPAGSEPTTTQLASRSTRPGCGSHTWPRRSKS